MASSSGTKKKIWGESESLLILQSVADFKANNEGTEPTTDEDLCNIADSVRKRHSGEFSIGQLRDKIRKLKREYYVDTDSMTEFEKDARALAQMIWAKDAGREEEKNERTETEGRKMQPLLKPHPVKRSTNMNDDIAADEDVGEEEEGESGPFPTLVETVRAMAKRNGLASGMLERAVKAMTPEIANSWEKNFERMYLEHINQQKNYRAMESDLLVEINSIIEEADKGEEGEHYPCSMLVEIVQVMEKKVGLTCGMFERVIKAMTPIDAKKWETIVKNMCCYKICLQSKQYELESDLLEAIEFIIKDTS